jgi:outer membrane protein TolC
MKRKEIMFIALLFLAFNTLFAQTKKDSVLSFSLKTAQDYALQNSPVVKNANLDLESAKKKIWETAAIGLPQVNSKLAYSYQITIPSLETQFSELTNLGGWMYGVDHYLYMTSGNNPGFGHIPAPDPNQKPVTEKDLRWGLTYDITASEIIFSGAYLVGLQTTKVYKQLSEQGVTKSQHDIAEQVTNAYYLVLIAQENTSIIDSSYTNTEKIFDYVNALHTQGFLEENDVDQMQLTLSTLKNTKDMLTRQTEVAMNLLKFQMGIDLAKQITLTDNLTTLIESSDLLGITTKDFKVENNNDYKLMETQEKLSGLNVKLQKSSLLPDIVGFYTHEENFNKNSFSFTPPNMVGVSVNIPLFGSGMKLAKISQAKIGLEKAKNSKEQVSLGLQITFSDAKSSFITAFERYQTNKKNILLAEKIYNKSLVKYKEGIIGSMELTQSQNQYLLTQSNYYTSVIELTTAKSKLEKLLK